MSIFTSTHIVSVLIFLGYNPETDFEAIQISPSEIEVRWLIPDPGVTEETINLNEKPWAASVKREEIFREQEIRSANIDTTATEKLGIEMPRAIVNLLEETYLKILVPAARNPIDEVDSPTWWGLQQLRNNRNTLLAHLQVWVDDPQKTAEDILAFDVASWAGWSIDRPS